MFRFTSRACMNNLKKGPKKSPQKGQRIGLAISDARAFKKVFHFCE